MSYDLWLFELAPGADEGERARRCLGALDEQVLTIRPLDPEKERRKQALAAAIRAANPAYAPAAFDYDALARWEKLTLEAVRAKYRHVELNGPGDHRLAQILLHDDHAVIHWYSGTRGEDMERLLRVICEQTAWVVYDPQVGRVDRTFAER